MQNIPKSASGRRRLMTSAVAVMAAVGAVALTAVTTPADAVSSHDYRIPVFHSPAQVNSIFVASKGYAMWTVDGTRGQIGFIDEPASFEACYTYLEPNDGSGVRADHMYAYLPQVPGRQAPFGPIENRQGSNPTFIGGATMSINTFTSPDCTIGLVKQFKGVPVPDSGDKFDVDLN